MNKKEFNNLNIIDQIQYINKELENNKSITSVCKELDIGRSTIRDRFKKNNYIYSKKDNKYKQNILIKNTDKNDRNIELCYENKINEIINKSDLEIKNNLLELANNYDILKEIIEIHKCNTSVIRQQILIDNFEGESKLTTLRVNCNILSQFNSLCEKNRQYKKVDLLSQALKEFIDKYN